MNKKVRNAVRTFLIKNNKIVVIKYKTHDTGYYDIPGGKIENGETNEEASIREFKEETGINILKQHITGHITIEYPERIFELDMFIVDEFDGIPHEFEENSSLWIDLDELNNSDKLFQSIKAINYLKDNTHIYIDCDNNHNITNMNVKRVKLINPSKKYYKEYKDMMDEWFESGSQIAPWSLELDYKTEKDFEKLLNRLKEVENGINLEGYASSNTYWLLDLDTNKLIGGSNLRHYLDDKGIKYWGHIGYGIRPSERKKGYGTFLLKLTLEKAKEKGIDKVYLGAYEENIGSWKLMEKCNATFDKLVYEEETNKPIKKYWIET